MNVHAGQTDDLVVQLVDAIAQTGRDLAEPVRVHLDAGGLHLRQHVHQRQLDLAEEAFEAELDEPRALGRGHAPREHRARGRGRLGARALDQHGAVVGAGQGEQGALLLGQLRREQVGGHRRVEGRPARRRRVARLRLGVVHDGVRREQPQRGQPVGAGGGHLHGLAAGVDGDGEAVRAVLPRLERPRPFRRARAPPPAGPRRARARGARRGRQPRWGRPRRRRQRRRSARRAPARRRRPRPAAGAAGRGTRTSRRLRRRCRPAARSRRAPRARRGPPRAARRAPSSPGVWRGARCLRARPAARAACRS